MHTVLLSSIVVLSDLLVPMPGGGTVIDPWAGRVPPLDPWGAAARPLGTWGHGLPMPATDAERCDAEEALAMKQLLQRRLRSLR
jgi:hypothetical protein